jgi:predicted acetyltransferase
MGVGEHVACDMFDRFPGLWQVGEITENTTAITFWRKVIARYTHENYHEHILDNENWKGPVQSFSSPAA